MTLFDLEAENDPSDGIIRWAMLSTDGVYRYGLTRRWEEDGPVATFVMLNPSTADGREDDPTIRRCMGFARDWGCVALHVLNLYAYRATQPDAMWKAGLAGTDLVGPENDMYLLRHIAAANTNGMPLIAAWGANAPTSRADDVLSMPGAVAFECLGKTKAGAPRHPLYLPRVAQRQPVF